MIVEHVRNAALSQKDKRSSNMIVSIGTFERKDASYFLFRCPPFEIV